MLSLAAFGMYIIIQFFVQNLSQFTTKFTAAFGQCASHSSYFHINRTPTVTSDFSILLYA